MTPPASPGLHRWAPRRALLGCAIVACFACSTQGTTKLGIGEPCIGDNSACASDLCLQIDTSTSLCTEDCTSNSGCPSDFLCTTVPTAGSVCLRVGLNGTCASDADCSAGFECDTTEDRCYIAVSRGPCAPCTSDKECNGGVCRVDGSGQTCTAPCTANSDCPANYVCQSLSGVTGMQCVPNNMGNTCSPDLGICASCASDFECGSGNYCVTNLASNEQFCGTGCMQTSDCPSNFNCTDLSGVGTGPNACVPNSGTCAGYCDGTDADTVLRECGLAATCDLTNHTCATKMDGSLCAACQTDDDCSSMGNICLQNQCTDCPFAGQTFCSSSCDPTNATSCPTGFTCGTIGSGSGAPSYCLPNSGSCTTGQGDVGDNCTAYGPSQCASGICIGYGIESACSASCMTSSDCGNAQYQCCPTTNAGTGFDCTMPLGSAGGICAPIGGLPGADCSPGSPPCQSGEVCLNLGTADVCTLPCMTANDCQAALPGFVCSNAEQQNGDGTVTSLSVCFPPGGGTLGANCDFGPAACQSGLCLQRTSGNVCTQSCTTAMDCGAGYACEEEQLSSNAMKTQLVCVPVSL